MLIVRNSFLYGVQALVSDASLAARPLTRLPAPDHTIPGPAFDCDCYG